MPPLEVLLAGVLLAALVLYFLLGGADFGGGVWDLLASGPRREAQRALIERAIGPVWEANHVWLILVVVVLFSAFPPAFAALSVALHVPLTLFLVGIVFRGSAFVFRAYDEGDARRRRWGGVFSGASLLAPALLGMCVGALASGDIRLTGEQVSGGFFAPWLRPFPLATGAFAVALCAFLAATYLAYEAPAPELQEDFRRRALASGVAVGALAALGFVLAIGGAPRIAEGLTRRPWTWPFHLATAAAALAALGLLVRRRYALARLAAGAQTALILLGWALSQYPYLLVPDLTLHGAAANPRTLRAVALALAVGVPVLAPSLWLLFRVFKGARG